MLFREFLIFRAFGLGAKCQSSLVIAKKDCFHTRHLLPTQFSLKANFVTAINKLCNLCYFCCSKMYFFMTVELSQSQYNNLISFISQILIGLYLIHSVHPSPHTFYWRVDRRTKFSKTRDFAKSQFLEWVAGKEEGDHFQELNSEIFFNGKKSL